MTKDGYCCQTCREMNVHFNVINKPLPSFERGWQYTSYQMKNESFFSNYNLSPHIDWLKNNLVSFKETVTSDFVKIMKKVEFVTCL